MLPLSAKEGRLATATTRPGSKEIEKRKARKAEKRTAHQPHHDTM
jgi:hypothetical protein